MTTTYTVAAAEATTATGIHVVDTVANILGALTYSAFTTLLQRVSLFSMSASGTVTATQAEALATALGIEFSTNGHALTIRDSVANLTASVNAQGEQISGASITVADTAANILAAIGTPLIHNAAAIALTASASLTLAQLLTLESFPSFTAVGVTLTLVDTAANLLAFTAAEAKPALTIFHLSASATVTVSQALTLAGLSHFAVNSPATLTVSGTIGSITGSASSLSVLLAMSGVAVNFADTLSNLLAQAATFNWYKYPGVTVTLSAGGQTSAANLLTLEALPSFSVASGVTLTVADTLGNLLTLSPAKAAFATSITLNGNGIVNATQLATLASFGNFTAGSNNTLTLDDTLAHIAAITPRQQALVGAVTIDDTVTDLLLAQVEYASEVTAATKIIAELDGTTISAAQAVTLAALGAHATLSLHTNGSNTTLTISDTQADLNAAAASITALEADGSVSVIPQTATNRSILTASAAAALVVSGISPADETLSVADSGAALTTYASNIFGQGFETITVTTGGFAGSMAQLLDPTLHFAAGSTAQLDATALADTEQTLALAALPGFNLAGGVTLIVQDTIANILAAAATLGTVALGNLATSIQATDSETVTAAGAATLATLGGFSLHGNFLNIEDTATNLAAAPAGAIALAVGVSLASDARISVATADQFAAMGSKFSPNGFFILVSDTVSDLDMLAANSATLATVNSWGGEATLSANGPATVANAAALLKISGFNVGVYHLTLSDTGSNLLAAGSTVLALAYAVQLSQASTVSAAGAATLETMQNFAPEGFLTIADTPAALAAMSATIAAEATAVTLTAEGGNSSAYAIDAAQFAAMLGLPNFSLAGFAGTVAVSDTASALAALAPSLTGLSGSVLPHITMTLDASATVTAATAATLDGLPGFSVGSASLTISDTAAALAGLNAGTASLAHVIELNTPASLTVTAAASLAALAHFTTDADPVTIADTPANLAAQSAAAASIATVETILPYSVSSSADYTLNANQFTALVGHSDLSLAGFSGPLILQDTATNLAGLAAAFTNATPGSPIAQASVVVTTELYQGATVGSQAVTELMALPNFSLNGQTLILQDTPTALLTAFTGLHPHVSEVELATNGGTPWTVYAQQAAELAAMGTFNAGPDGMIVSDTATNLLAAAYTAGVAAATATELDAAATVSVSEFEALLALPDFSRDGFNLTVSDTAANIATLLPATKALATSIEIIGGTTSGGTNLTVAEFLSLIASGGFSGGAASLTVADTAADLLNLVGNSNLADVGTTILQASGSTVTGLQAEQLNTLPNLQVGSNLAIVDSAANLLFSTSGGSTPDDWTIVLQANSVTLNASATSGSSLTAAQAALLAALGSHFHNGGFTVTVADSPTALLGLLNTLGPISSQISAVTLSAPSGSAWSISGLATMAELRTLPDFAGSSVALTIADTVSDLTASATSGLITAIITSFPNATFTLAGDDTATVAQAEKLDALGVHFSLGESTLTITDTAHNLATLDNGTADMATSILLQDGAVTSVANYQKISVLPNFSDSGNALVVSDTAANLLSLLSGTNLTFITETTLSTPDPGITAATAEQLTTLPGFTTGIAYITIQDTAADLTAGSGAHPTDWQGELRARSITLSESGPAITAAQADELAALGSRFSTGSVSLAVSDSAENLLSAANAAGVALAGAVSLAGDEDGLTAASWAQLNALHGFSKGGYSVTISDTAADLAAANPMLLAAADHVQLSVAATATVAAAEALIGLVNYQASATLTIADTLQNLLLLGSADLANNGGLLATTPIELSANAIANVAQMTALAALVQSGSFSLNDYSITLEDSGLNIADFVAITNAVPSAYVMVGDATLSAAQAQILVNDNATIGTNHLTIADTPGNLQSVLSNEAVYALATTLSLAGPTTMAASQIEVIAADPKFTTGGYALTVTGSAMDLVGLGSTADLATSLVMTGSDNTVSADGLQTLTDYGSRFTTNSLALTVADNATDLAGINAGEAKLLTGAVLNATPGAAIDTATATELGNLPDFTLGPDVMLTVQGSFEQLEALPNAILSVATLEVTGSATTLTVAEAVAVAASSNFTSLPGVIVEDTIANLASTTAWQSVATGGYIVADSAADLLAKPTSALIENDAVGLDSVTLTQDAQESAANFATLAALQGFSIGTAALTVTDTAPAIAGVASQIAALGATALVDSPAPVTAAEAEALAGLNGAGKLSFTGGILLAVQDTYANIIAIDNAAGIALANSVTVVDSPAELLVAAAHNWGSLLPDFEPNAGGTIVGQDAATLYALGSRFVPVNGDVITVQDTVAGILGNQAAIDGLGLNARVVDRLANVDGAIASLQGLGTTLQSITLTDSGAVGASAAADVQPLVSLLSSSIAVSDNVSDVDGSLAGLQDLGTHLTSVTVNDLAGNIGPVASALVTAFGSKLQFVLTDSMALSAGAAAGLAPVVAYLAANTSFAVGDMASSVSTNLNALEALIGHGLTGITLSDITTPDITVTYGQLTSDAAVLNLISSLFEYAINDSSGTIAGDLADSQSKILALNTAGMLGSITVSGGVLSLSFAVLTADGVDTNAGDALTKLVDTSIQVTGITIADFAAFAGMPEQPSSFTISDSGYNIQTDLEPGGGGVLLAHLGSITSIIADGSIELDYTTATAAGVNDGPGSVLSLISTPSLIVDDVPVSKIVGLLTSLTDVVPASITVSDTAGHIQTDLSGGSPVLVTYASVITGITSSGTITLDADHALAAGVDDDATSVFAKLGDSVSLDVTGALVAQLGELAALTVKAVSVTVLDSGSAIGGDLENPETGGTSLLQAHLGNLTGITASSSIEIDYTTDTATHVNDGPGSVLSLVSGAGLIVDDVPVNQIVAVLTSGTDVVPVSISVSDTAGDIETDLAGSSPVLVTYASKITSITTSGTITLDASHALAAGVDNGLGSVFSKTGGALSLDVTGALVSQLTQLADLGVPPASITVSDSAGNLEAALVSGSTLVNDVASHLVTGIANTEFDVTLEYAVLGASVDAAVALLPSDSLVVNDVAVAGIITVAGFAGLVSMTVRDSADAIGTDLASSPSELENYAGEITQVSLTDSGAILAAAAAGVSPVASKLAGTIDVSDTAAMVDANLIGLQTLGGAGHLGTVTLDDDAADIAPYASALLAAFPTLRVELTDLTPPILTAAAAVELGVLASELGDVTLDVADTLADIVGSAAGLAGLGSLLGTITINGGTSTTNVAGAVALSPIASNLGESVSIDVADSAAAISGNTAALTALQDASHLGTVFAAGQSAADVVLYAADLAGIGATATISDTAAGVSTNLDTLVTAVIDNVLTGITLSDHGTPDITLTSLTQLTADAAVLNLISTPFDYAISDSSTAIADDLGDAGSSHLLTLNQAGRLASVTVDGGTLYIDAGTLLDTGVDDSATAALARLVADTAIAATGVSIADFASFATSLHVQPSSFAVSDFGTAIAGDLELEGSDGSALLAHLGAITAITADGTIEIDYATDTATHVNDGAGSVLSLVTNSGDAPTLIVDDVTVGEVAALLTPAAGVVLPGSINVSDNANNIEGDLESGSPVLLGKIDDITAIVVTDSSSITLDAVHALAGGIDDGVDSVFSKMSGVSLDVIDAPVSQLGALAALLPVVPTVAVSDDAGTLAGQLVPDSTLVNAVATGLVTGIASDDGDVILPYAAPANAVTNTLALLPHDSLMVTGVPVTGIAAVGAYAALASMTVTDNAADIQGDLVGDDSMLVLYAGKITSVSLTDGNPILAATAAGISALGTKIITPIEVSDTVADVNTSLTGLQTLASDGVITSVTLDDTAAAVAASASALFADFGSILHADLSDGPTESLDAPTAAALSVLAGKLGEVTINVTDTLADIANNAAGLAVLGDAGNLGTLTSSGGSSATTTAANAVALYQFASYFGEVSIGVQDTAAQIASHAEALAPLLSDSFVSSIMAAGDSAADVAANYAALHGLGATATISDTAANVSAALDGLEAPATDGVLTNITLTDGGTPDITLSLTQYTTDAAVLAKIEGSFNYAISDTSAAILYDLGQGDGSTILALSQADPDRLASITVSGGTLSLDPGTLLDAGVDDSDTAALTKLVAETVIAATGVTITDFAAFAEHLYVQPTSFAVSDLGSAIAGDLALGGSSALLNNRTEITGITADGTIEIAYTTDIAGHVNDGTGSVLSLVTNAPTLIVTDVQVGEVAALLTPAAGVVLPDTIYVSDTAGEIQDDLETGSPVLLANVGDITGIVVSPSGTITLDADHVLVPGVDNGPDSVFGKMTGATLDVTDATVAQLDELATLTTHAASITVSDSAANLEAALVPDSTLVNDVASHLVTGIASSDVDVTLAYTALNDTVDDALALLPSPSLIVTGVPVAGVEMVALLPAYASMTVQDTGEAIAAALGANSPLTDYYLHITSVTVIDTIVPLTDAEALGATSAALGLLPSGSVEVSAVAVGDIATVAGIGPLASMTVSDTASNIQADLAKGTTNSELESQASLITAPLTVTADSGTVALTDAQTDAVPLAVAKLPANSLTVSLVPLSDLASIDELPAVLSIAVQDSAGTLSGDLANIGDSTPSLLQNYLPKIISITPTTGTGTVLLTGAQADVAMAELALLAPESLTVSAVLASDVANLATLGSVLAGITVQDSGADVQTYLGALSTDIVARDVALSIDLTGAVTNSTAITLNAANYTLYAAVLDEIATVTGVVRIDDGAAEIGSIASALEADPIVGSVEVSDTAADILANLTALDSLGPKLTLVKVTDNDVNASEVASLLTIPNLQTGSLVISDTGSQIAAAIEANGIAGVDFLNLQTVELSANSVIAASDAAALAQLDALQLNGHTLVVWDTASHLTDTIDGYLAAVQNPLITGVYLKTTGGTATLTAATAVTLLDIATFSKDNPPTSVGGTGGTNVVTLVDTAAHIVGQFSELDGLTSKLSGVEVSTSATVSDAGFADLLALGAVMALNQTLTVSDTVANILEGVSGGQLGGSPSIVPMAWQLSGSASVSEANAALLGSLPNVSAGADTLTLMGTGAQIAINATTAEELGNLGSALVLNGNQLIVDDNVADVLPLSAAARAIVTLNITDTFADIASLVAGDGLLTGSITVTDSNPAATVSEATGFFGLLGVAGGISAANVSFGTNVETVTGSVSAIEGLLANSGWTSNASLHSDFHLVMSDTVQNLVGVGASVLTSLCAMTLSGVPTAISAASAETLLPETQFHLNTVLTVSDTSANLLDGVLDGVVSAANAADAGYGGSVQVTLSDTETLDASTAEALVSLDGFVSNGNLSIADESSYLLNANAAAAEHAATYVTLVGDETVSVATAIKLAALQHFQLQSNILFLASDDYASGTALTTLADMGSGFQLNGNTLTLTSNASVTGAELAALGDFGSDLALGTHTLTLTTPATVDAAELAGIGTFGSSLVTNGLAVTLTQNALDLTTAEYTALQAVNVQLNGNLWSAEPSGVEVNENSGTASFSGTGVNGAMVHLYDASGNVLTSAVVASSAFTVSASDGGANFALTQTVGGTESSPLIYLEETILTNAAGADGASFATSGQVQVAAGEYINLYTAGSQPATLTNPVLVYNPTADTLSYDDSHGPILLVTLGTSTHPATLDASEIIVKHV